MRLREVLTQVQMGTMSLERAEDEIMYNCPEVIYTESDYDEDEDEDDLPTEREHPSVEQFMVALRGLPPDLRATVLEEIKRV